MASIIQPYQVTNQYKKAESYSFSFANSEKKYNRARNYKQKVITERLGGKVSPFWIFMSLIGIISGICFGIYAAFNAELALAGIIDPRGDGTIPVSTVRAIGIAISVIGMLLGHLLYECVENAERDPITGDRRNLGWLWVLIPAALIYIFFQVKLVQAAGSGTEEIFTGAIYLPYIALGIALLELIVGAFILDKGFAYLILFVVTILSGLFIWRINQNARLTNESYRLYLSFLDTYNNNKANPIEREGNNNIRRAIAYYVGMQEQQNDDTTNEKGLEENAVPVSANHPNPTAPKNGNGSASNSVTGNNHQEDLASFIDDNIDDDLTM